MEVSLQEGIVLCPNVKGKGSCLKIFLHLLIKLLAISFCILNPLFEAISGRSETDTFRWGADYKGKKTIYTINIPHHKKPSKAKRVRIILPMGTKQE